METSTNTPEYQTTSSMDFEHQLRQGNFITKPSKVSTKYPRFLPFEFSFHQQGKNQWQVNVLLEHDPKQYKPHFFEVRGGCNMYLIRHAKKQKNESQYSWTIRRPNTDTILVQSKDEREAGMPDDVLKAVQEMMDEYFIYLTHLKFLEARQPRIDKKIVLNESGTREVLAISGVWKRPGTERDIYSPTFDYDLTFSDSPKLVTSSLDWHLHRPQDHVQGVIMCKYCHNFYFMPSTNLPVYYAREKKVVLCGICTDEFQVRYDWDPTQWE